MSSQEREDLAIDFISYLNIVKESDSATVANSATDMVKEILERNPKIRYLFFQWNQENLLSELGLDYGTP